MDYVKFGKTGMQVSKLLAQLALARYGPNLLESAAF